MRDRREINLQGCAFTQVVAWEFDVSASMPGNEQFEELLLLEADDVV